MRATPAPEDFEPFPVPITVGVVSDTHLSARGTVLPAPLVEGLSGVDLILHAGDVNTLSALRRFEAIAPVRAVAGNNDDLDLRDSLPRLRFLRFGPHTAGLMHGDGYDRLTARQAAEKVLAGRVDVAVFGHSHQPLRAWVGGSLLLNPGSPTQRRWQPRYSYALLWVGDAIEAELRYF